MDIEITQKQRDFIRADANEVLFGGAAGGGKSYGQLIDAFLYALKYAGSKQLILRRTYGELERSLIRVSMELYPREIYTYNDAKHVGRFKNGSIIDFGYCDAEKDVYQYQSAEYDVIRFDELTHFTEDMYIYLISRVRGANDFPKGVKSSTNPGGVGHTWVKDRFIDLGAWESVHDTPTGTRVFIPSKIQDNVFLMDKDPEYLKRLENLSDKDKKALLYGDWDIFDGQYFTEFDRKIHVITPFIIPDWWRVYFTMDYGLDMLAGLWIAVDDHKNAYAIDEIYIPNLKISDAAEAIKAKGHKTYVNFAPPDLYNRRQETGKSVVDWFHEAGIGLVKSNNNRVAGWLAIKEWLKPYEDVDGVTTAPLKVFENCKNLIRTLPSLQYDTKNPSDTAKEPHELTHLPDALRGFCVMNPRGSTMPEPKKIYNFDFEKPKPNPLGKGAKINVI